MGAALAVLAVLCALFAASASAAPAWKFGEAETPLSGKEVILGGAYESSMTIPGMTTSCENFLYELSIENSSGTGKGTLTEMPLFNCHTNSKYCGVESAQALELPWSSHLTTVSTTPYVVFEKANVGILYEGEACVLNETLILVTGSAGGSIDNASESATFNAATLKATGTALFASETPIEWKGVFPTEAFQSHREQKISVS
jgi:hypothetical protein